MGHSGEIMKYRFVTNLMIVVFLIMVTAFTLNGCSRNANKRNHNNTLKITSRSVANTLYYTGNILPIKSLVVTSPAEGVVIDMPFQFGEKIKTGDMIFTIASEKFFTDYKNALLAYIKAKNEFNNSQTQLSEAKFLHQHELMPEDDFKMKKSSFYVSQLGLLQAKDALQDLMRQSNMKEINLNTLSIADIDKITNAMHLKNHSQNLKLVAPAAGVLLAPPKGEEENKKVAKGDVVKQGDVLAVIGDMSGLSVRIKVNELTINQMKPGQKVRITGIAFPDYSLNGEVERVDRQGEQSSGGIPNFSVEIAVKKLSLAEQQAIHVGMSAKVEIVIEEEPKIMVPVSAVYEKNGESYVDVYDSQSKEKRAQLVKTGKTTIDSVAILSGLKTGDSIVSAH